MSSSYKCPICGETEHYSVEILEGGRGSELALFEPSYLEGNIWPHCDAYVCKKCGHVDFFASGIANKMSAAQRERAPYAGPS